MISIKQILTKRRFEAHAFFQIVYEWENVLAQSLSLPIKDDLRLPNIFCCAFCRFFPTIARQLKPRTPSFVFAMSTIQEHGNNNKNIIPCIIDFFINDPLQLKRFYKDYNRNPIVLISSKEAFEYLKANNCPLPIKHWPLSIPDQHATSQALEAEKQYDIAIVGRSNPILSQFLDRYIDSHPQINCLRRIRRNEQFIYRSTKDGKEYLGNTRDEYIRIVQMTKVGLYATPALDDSKPDANGFNQVTPRFLELIASGCHVIARYPRNPDTDFYELDKFSPNVETYGQFEQRMNWALANPIDKSLYTSYISKHTTSARATQLLEILRDA